ncbi:hypothetical protein AAGS61_04490 [Lysinibacillus sp. KU-BSD001]|uniref:hypothetical protein n=1 Tax=Lysinibacillus sp. KU-BSD001 TaxID=3141328 RepID=UPI0036EAA3A9
MNNKKWQDFYLFMFDIKTTVGIYFLAFVFFYLVFGVLEPENATTLDFWTAMQIFTACWLIGMGEGLLLYKKDVSFSRILLWSVWAFFIMVGFSEGFGWFSHYTEWYRYIFYSMITISFFFYWLALDWRLQKETKDLNDALVKYKEIMKK